MTGTEKYLQHHKLNRADLEEIFNGQGSYTYTIANRLLAQVVDTTDEVIVKAIIDYAREAGVTDLFLIDKEFIMSAINREIQYRKAMVDLKGFEINYQGKWVFDDKNGLIYKEPEEKK